MPQVTLMWKLFMEANVLQHRGVFPKSCHLKDQDEMGLACKKQDRTQLHQHGGRITESFRLENTSKVIKSNLVN